MTNNLTMYGTTAGFKEYSGIVEQVMLGQVAEWGLMPDSMVGIGMQKEFVEQIAVKSGMSLEKYMDSCSGKNTWIEIASQQRELRQVESGEAGTKILLNINGTFSNPIERKTFWTRKPRHFESDSDLKAKVCLPDSSTFSEIQYHGKLILSGPDYAISGIRDFFNEAHSDTYKLNLVLKAQHLAFVSKY